MSSFGAVKYIRMIEKLQAGDLGTLRTLRNKTLHNSLHGFDLFTGLWWGLRQENQFAPRREPAWLVLKLYAVCPLKYVEEASFPALIGKLSKKEVSIDKVFDQILGLPITLLEHHLQYLLGVLRHDGVDGIDWAELIDDLSFWNDGKTRKRWLNQYTQNKYKETQEVSDVN